jgi:hypothetical protein
MGAIKVWLVCLKRKCHSVKGDRVKTAGMQSCRAYSEMEVHIY